MSIPAELKERQATLPNRCHPSLRLFFWPCPFLLAGCLLQVPARQPSLPVDTWYPDNFKAQALANAPEYGDDAEVRRLMKDEKVNPDRISVSGVPLLAYPTITESPEGLKAMLDNGANPNMKQAYAHTPPPELRRMRMDLGFPYEEKDIPLL